MSDRMAGVIQGVALAVVLVCAVAMLLGEYSARDTDRDRLIMVLIANNDVRKQSSPTVRLTLAAIVLVFIGIAALRWIA